MRRPLRAAVYTWIYCPLSAFVEASRPVLRPKSAVAERARHAEATVGNTMERRTGG